MLTHSARHRACGGLLIHLNLTPSHPYSISNSRPRRKRPILACDRTHLQVSKMLTVSMPGPTLASPSSTPLSPSFKISSRVPPAAPTSNSSLAVLSAPKSLTVVDKIYGEFLITEVSRACLLTGWRGPPTPGHPSPSDTSAKSLRGSAAHIRTY